MKELEKGESALVDLFTEALREAHKAMEKYPVPNKTTLKIAEEAGEVVRECVKVSEGRGDLENLRLEIVQNMAMLIRLAIEGDRTIGVPAILETK